MHADDQSSALQLTCAMGGMLPTCAVYHVLCEANVLSCTSAEA